MSFGDSAINNEHKKSYYGNLDDAGKKSFTEVLPPPNNNYDNQISGQIKEELNEDNSGKEES